MKHAIQKFVLSLVQPHTDQVKQDFVGTARSVLVKKQQKNQTNYNSSNNNNNNYKTKL